MSTAKPNTALATLLAQMPKVRESGFTKRIAYRLHLRELRRRALFFTAWCCALAGILLSLPMERLIAPLIKLQHTSSVGWPNYASANQLTHTLVEYLQIGNINGIVALSVGAALLVLATFALLQE